ncbi:MAG TPA: hypothetical protein PKK26_18350, partial [Candidatus Wallbacteria bacterium]|nr:hypothetical protein [Candidatus Wallbacteria bacterium]
MKKICVLSLLPVLLSLSLFNGFAAYALERPAEVSMKTHGKALEIKPEYLDNITFSAVVSYPKLEKANAEIKQLSAFVNALAPGSGGFKTWNDRLIGYYSINYGKKINDKFDMAFSTTYGNGALDNHTASLINTPLAPYSAANATALKADFRQEYTSKTLSAGPKYKWKAAGFEFGFAARLGYIYFHSETTYGINFPGSSSLKTGTFDKHKFYGVFDLEAGKRFKLKNGKEIAACLYFDYIPNCRLNNDGYGYEIKNGVKTDIIMPTEID